MKTNRKRAKHGEDQRRPGYYRSTGDLISKAIGVIRIGHLPRVSHQASDPAWRLKRSNHLTAIPFSL